MCRFPGVNAAEKTSAIPERLRVTVVISAGSRFWYTEFDATYYGLLVTR
jgi:hypothetical protein